jgi:exosortase F-associated protein
MNRSILPRIIVGILSVAGMITVFLFQRVDIAATVGVDDKVMNFIVNRTIRFLLNDLFALGLIYSIFAEKKYLVFSLWVQLAGVILILLPYFILKIFLINYNGPMISFLHRLVMNPTLLLLLIPAFYYKR